MTKTVARHRAPLSTRAWAARTWLAVSTLPAGALAGCTTVGVAAAVDRPVVGLLGLGALVVPLSLASWRARLTDVDPAHGRRAAGRPLVAVAEPVLEPVVQPATELERLPIVLDAPDLASLQAATASTEASAAQDAASRVFTVAAGGTEVEVLVLTREERAASDLALLQEMDAAPAAAAPERERVAA